MIDMSKEDILQPIKFRDFDNVVKEINPKQVLSFDSDNLPYETQATTYFTVSQLAEKAYLNFQNAKVAVDKAKSELYAHYVISLKDGTKKPTEAQINSAILSTDVYTEALKAMNKLEYNYRVLLRLTKAFEQRKDLIQTLSASKRAELSQGYNTAFSSDDTTNKANSDLIKKM